MSTSPGGTEGYAHPQEPVPEDLADYVSWAINTRVKSGRFQFVYMVLLCFAYGIPCVHTYGNMFASLKPAWHQRSSAEPAPTLMEKFNCSVPEDEWEVDDPSHSLIADFKLICSRHQKIPLLGSIYFGGFATGVVACGSIADMSGRRWGYMFGYAVIAIGGLLAPLSFSYVLYAVARFLLGFGVGGIGVVSFVWLAEFLDPSLRPVMSWAPNVMFSMGQLLDSPLAYHFLEWRKFLLVIHGICLIGMAFWPFMKESPKFLASKGRENEAYAVVCSMAECNGRPKPPPPRPAKGRTDFPVSGKLDAKSENICLQLCDRRLRFRFVAMCVSWFSVSFAFYGIAMFAPNLPFDVYVANALNALIAVPFYLVAPPLIAARWCGRKGASAGSLLMGGACLLASTFINNNILSMIVYYLGTGAFSLAFAIIYMWAAELFPTDIRTRSISFQSIFARIGSMLSPFVVDIGETNPRLALTIFAVPCIASGIIDMFLPETRGLELPNTLADIDGDSSELESDSSEEDLDSDSD